MGFTRKQCNDMEGGCNTCTHFSFGHINMHGPDKPAYCKAGQASMLTAWWKENGHKKMSEELLSAPCYAHPETTRILDSMMETVSRGLDRLNE